jgi:hypothetical protein
LAFEVLRAQEEHTVKNEENVFIYLFDKEMRKEVQTYQFQLVEPFSVQPFCHS